MDKMKRNIIISITTLVVIALIGGIFLIKGGSSLDEKAINKVVDNRGKASNFSSSENEVKVDVSGDIDKEEAKAISKDILNLDKKSNKKLVINFIKDGTSSKDEFYYDGLVNRATVKKDSNDIEFETFINGKAEKSKTINDYNDHKLLTAENNKLIVSLNMNLKDIKDEEAVGQIKSYIEMFKSSNKDKNIESLQVNLKSSDKGYNYCDKNDDVYSIVEYLN